MSLPTSPHQKNLFSQIPVTTLVTGIYEKRFFMVLFPLRYNDCFLNVSLKFVQWFIRHFDNKYNKKSRQMNLSRLSPILLADSSVRPRLKDSSVKLQQTKCRTCSLSKWILFNRIVEIQVHRDVLRSQPPPAMMTESNEVRSYLSGWKTASLFVLSEV